MNNFCRSCEDQDRSSDNCALMPLRTVFLLKSLAVVQRIDESGPMFPHEAVAVHLRSSTGNTPRQIHQKYKQAVRKCIFAHLPEVPDNVVKLR